MKIITWNCNMAFRKKAHAILTFKPDILIVPECECQDKLKFELHTQTPNDVVWFGTNKHKGLAIFSYSDYRFKTLENHNQALRTIIPIEVTGGVLDFILFAIWANNTDDADGQYIEQVWKAIHHYDDILISKPVFLIGDFNSNTIWDRKRRAGNHSNAVGYLEERKIYSAYHRHHKQIQGKEEHPTFYLYRHQNKTYHLDYCFLSSDLADRVLSVEIGEHEFWTKYSDHVPVIVDISDSVM